MHGSNAARSNQIAAAANSLLSLSSKRTILSCAMQSPSLARLGSLLIPNDELHERHLTIPLGDGTTTSTTNGDLTSLCCVCQDRASGRHYGVLSCEVNYPFAPCRSIAERTVSSAGLQGFLQTQHPQAGSVHLSEYQRLPHQQVHAKSVSTISTPRKRTISPFCHRCQYCRLQKCLQVGMRVEAVQNERRPYSSKHDAMNNGHHAQHMRKVNEANVGRRRCFIVAKSSSLQMLNSSVNDIQGFLSHSRNDPIRIINENKTLHSILTSTSRVQTPTTRTSSARRVPLELVLNYLTAVFLSPPSSSSSSSLSTTTTSLHIDCNIKTESSNSQNAAAITRAFDNLAKAAAHVRLATTREAHLDPPVSL